MGAWEVGNLDNDTALDWLGDWAQAPSSSSVASALQEALTVEEHLDSDVACEALAAAEVVAAAMGRPVQASPAVAGYLDAATRTPGLSDLAPLAGRAGARVAVPDEEHNELYGLWEEGEAADEWLEVVHDLKRRLEP